MFIDKIVVVLLLVWCPCVVYAETYTIDKRQYVSEECKAIAPFKHVLRMGNWCSAVMVEGSIMTAKHCLYDESRDKEYSFDSYDGHLSAALSRFGDFQSDNPVTFSGDWAVLTPDASDSDGFVSQNSVALSQRDAVGHAGLFVLAGYGGLRVMSDEEIARFQKAYAEYLRTRQVQDKYFDQTNALNRFGERGIQFIDDLKSDGQGGADYSSGIEYSQKYGLYYSDFIDDRLKYSWTKAASMDLANKGMLQNFDLQAWQGDSGAGIYWYAGGVSEIDRCLFGDTGATYYQGLLLESEQAVSLIGLHTRGGADIGGARHLGRDYTDAVSVWQFKDAVQSNLEKQ